MGIDVDGRMILGGPVSDTDIDIGDEYECLWEWAEEHGLAIISPWYDAEEECCFIGVEIDDTDVSDMNTEWLENIQNMASDFKELTKMDAKLIGMQHVT